LTLWAGDERIIVVRGTGADVESQVVEVFSALR